MSGEHCICESEGFDERVRASTLDDDTAMDLSDLFKLFGDSTRLRILWVLKGNEMCVDAISGAIGVSVSAVSHQLKALKSAGANAENNQGRSTDSLFVAKCYANQGPTLKRYIPKAHGRAGGLLKRTSHITIVLDEIRA